MYHYRTFIALILIGLFVPVSAWAQTHLFHPVEQPLSNSYVRCIYKDSKGYLWAGTFNGLNRYDGAGIKTYHHEAGQTNTLSHNMVNALLEDHQQTLWVGTSEGLNYYDREKDAFHYIIHRPDLENRHNNSCITALCQPDTTTLWMGTRGGGVNIYRYAEKRFDFLFLTASKLLDEASNHITCLQQHHMGRNSGGTVPDQPGDPGGESCSTPPTRPDQYQRPGPPGRQSVGRHSRSTLSGRS